MSNCWKSHAAAQIRTLNFHTLRYPFLIKLLLLDCAVDILNNCTTTFKNALAAFFKSCSLSVHWLELYKIMVIVKNAYVSCLAYFTWLYTLRAYQCLSVTNNKIEFGISEIIIYHVTIKNKSLYYLKEKKMSHSQIQCF